MNGLPAALNWLEALVALGAFLLISILPVAQEIWRVPEPRWTRMGPLGYSLLLLGTLFLWRWPAFFVTGRSIPTSANSSRGP